MMVRNRLVRLLFLLVLISFSSVAEDEVGEAPAVIDEGVAGGSPSTTSTPIPSAARDAARNASRDADRARARTLAVLGAKTETGRVVLLLCKQLCPRQRRQIPQWVRGFNDEQMYPLSDAVAYHYYLLRRPLPFLNETEEAERLQFPALLYLIGKEVIFYSGDITSKTEVQNWLRSLDVPLIEEPQSVEELDGILNTAECSSRYLLYSPTERCSLDFWHTIARLVHIRENITTVHIPRPADDELSVVLFKRLPEMGEEDCLLLTLVHLHVYAEPFHFIKPAEVHERVRELTTEDSCVRVDDAHVYPIVPKLSEMQMEFFSSERRLQEASTSVLFLLVGLVGGVAVIALAISIFWGLNGSAFTAQTPE